MTDVRRLTDPAAWPSLADALQHWLPRQRWFAGKDRTIVSAQIVDAFLLPEPTTIVDVIVEVAYREGGTEWYQVPLTAVSGSHPDDEVTRVDELPVIDAMSVDEAVRTLASQAVDTTPQPTVQGAAVVGRLPERPADQWPALASGPGTGRVVHDFPEPQPLAAEQSNSSVVFGEALILKLFRRLEAGTNPDVEVTRALTEQGFPHVPAQRASFELRPAAPRAQEPPATSGDDDAEGQTTALAVLSDFVPGGEQGWALATGEVAGLARAGRSEPDSPLQGAFGDLGDVIARLHTALAKAFDTREADSTDVVAWSREMTAQAERVLDTAGRHAPAAARPVLERRSELLSRLEHLASQAQGGRLLRIHGDLHLGQVLRDRQGVWQILDFEGEPARSLAHRRALNTPLRDVAGMLRSIDYAAATSATTAEGELPPAVARWRDNAKTTFLESYLDVATREGLVAHQPEVRDGQLAAFELDKAVYELGYELANRPAWAHIPLNGIIRVLDTGKPGT